MKWDNYALECMSDKIRFIYLDKCLMDIYFTQNFLYKQDKKG